MSTMESLPLDDEISSSRNEVKPMLTTSQKNFKQGAITSECTNI